MAGGLFRLSVAALLAALAGGCAGAPDELRPPESASTSQTGTPVAPLECVPYARAHSGINIFGDAYTWWDQAAGRFERGPNPKQGAVLVLAGYAGPNRAHLAVVHTLLNAREITVDHANWLDDGAVYEDDPVADVSQANDWSQVRVWNMRASAWGTRTYQVEGFIGPGPATAVPTDKVAVLFDPRSVISH
jgi:hypothetical protein